MAPIDAATLLKRLEPAIRSVATGAPTAPQQPLESQRFDDLLALVWRGQVNSGREVASRIESDQPLDAAQLQRLAAAADLAESHGAGTALMLIDGRAIVMNIPERALTQELNGDPNRVEYAIGNPSHTHSKFVRLDAAVYVASQEESAGGMTIRLPASGFLPPAVSRLLAAAAADQNAHAA